MKFWGSFFRNSDSRWDTVKQENADDLTLCNVIEKFFKVDDLCPDKVSNNFEAIGNLERCGFLVEPFTVDAEFLKYTASLPFASNPMNRGIIYPNWFYTAYPDVIEWMNIYNEVAKKAFNGIDPEDATQHEKVFRRLIDRYSKQGRKLECAR